MSRLIKNAILDTMSTIVPENVSRPWYLEYLFKYKFGNRLPRGKIFDRLRQVENSRKWKSCREDLYSDIINFAHHDKVSPFLIDQFALLTLAKIHGLCDFKTKKIFAVINMLEGGACFGKENLVKHNVDFDKKRILGKYKHHHVPLLPNAYLSMLAKKDKNLNLINLEAIYNGMSFSDGKFNLDTGRIEKVITSRGANKGGRLTGHWLITLSRSGKTIYLGIFPHSDSKADDIWIRDQLIESERIFNRAMKRA